MNTDSLFVLLGLNFYENVSVFDIFTDFGDVIEFSSLEPRRVIFSS